MAKIGSVLQETRLSKGLTLDSIADETNISVRFLSKLENDDFTGFPGEPYIIGFIRNYADYLGLEAEALVARYRSRGMAQEPAPGGLPAGGAGDGPAERAPGTSAPAPAAEAEKPSPASVLGTAQAETTQAGSGDVADKAKNAGEPDASNKPKTRKAARKKLGSQEASTPRKDTVPSSGNTAEKNEKPSVQLSRKTVRETGQSVSGPSLPPLRTIVLGGLVILIIGAAVVWIFVGGKLKGSLADKDEAPAATEYKVEGGDFQKRLYPGDSLLVPFNEDVYRISLKEIGETVILETPFGAKELRLGDSAELDPDADEAPDILVAVDDFQKDRPSSGALLRVSFSGIGSVEPEASGEVTVPKEPVAPPIAKSQDFVILRSTRGPYPFIAQVSFRGNCLFRYEADRKEWVEKYYTKGESININVTNALTLWSSNAQAVKLTIQASGGRSVDLEIGDPGEIAVKRLSWSKADSATWTLASSELD